MRLQEYLAAKGAIKTLTKKEADIFGIPYPLINGWPTRYSNVTVTPEMLDKLRAAFGSNSSASGLRVQRGIAAASGEELPALQKKTARQNDSRIGAPCRVCDAARTLLEYSGDDVARIMVALNVLRVEVGLVPVADKSPDSSDGGPPWVV